MKTSLAAHGMVLGKFLPPHLGHVHLVDFARRYVDDLTVVVGSLAAEPIPGDLRVSWMRELFPDVRVVHLQDENPQQPEEHPRFWKIWRESLLSVLPRAVDFVFASEAYGMRLAEILGASFVPVDPLRSAVPMSGTAVREDPIGNWRFLPPCVRPYFVKRVRIVGAESSGKTTLARALANRFDTVWVPEHARTLLESKGGEIVEADIERIARGQLASEDALARQANRVLFSDTDLRTTRRWSHRLFGGCAPWISELSEMRRYDLTILTGAEVPFEPDPVRYLPGERDAFLARLRSDLDAARETYVFVEGSHEQRTRLAAAAVERLLCRTNRAD